ncbi:MAG: hypothetical protein Q8O89_01085 [Nanoarchaeota archaeon]|nr:hypothetical protein [Nanoarchaeota archaeon]
MVKNPETPENREKPDSVPQHMWDRFKDDPEIGPIWAKKRAQENRMKSSNLGSMISAMAGSMLGINLDEESVNIDSDGLQTKIAEYDFNKLSQMRELYVKISSEKSKYDQLASVHKAGNIQSSDKRDQTKQDKLVFYIGMYAYSLSMKFNSLADLLKTTYDAEEFGKELNEKVDAIIGFSEQSYKFINQSNNLMDYLYNQPVKLDKIDVAESEKKEHRRVFKELPMKKSEAGFLLSDNRKVLESIQINKILMNVYDAISSAINGRAEESFNYLKLSQKGAAAYIESSKMIFKTKEQMTIANSTMLPIAQYLLDSVDLINGSIPATPTKYTRLRVACSDVVRQLAQ